MSSDIMSRTLDFNSFDLIYAGAQKNIGPAGVTLGIVNKNILGRVNRAIPTMLDYRNHIKEGSMLNTPPVFAIYVTLLNLRWLKSEGGIAEMQQRNDQKAEILYKALDESEYFFPTVAVDDRSKMNVCFVMENESLEKQFMLRAQEQGIYGIQGHRSVGGFRASLYNALPVSSVELLADAIRHFDPL